MAWSDVVSREALHTRADDFDLFYHISTHLAYPDEYHVPGIIGITFRWRSAPRLVFVTAIDVGAAVSLGERLGLDAGQAIAMIDSHERMHIYAQMAGVSEANEEAAVNVVDRAYRDVQGIGGALLGAAQL